MMPFRRSRSRSTTARRGHERFARRHQRAAVLERPGVVLHVGDLDASGAELDRVVDDRFHAIDVVAMDRRVDGQRHAELAHPAGHFLLLGAAALVAADAVGILGLRVDVLNGDLHVVEAARLQLFEPVALQQHRGGDEIGVEPVLGGRRDDLFEVAARRRLAAGQMHLQNAELGRLPHDFLPLGRRQLGVALFEFERIGAVGALQGTAMRELGEETDRRAHDTRRIWRGR